jgi:hypothetical protein
MGGEFVVEAAHQLANVEGVTIVNIGHSPEANCNPHYGYPLSEVPETDFSVQIGFDSSQISRPVLVSRYCALIAASVVELQRDLAIVLIYFRSDDEVREIEQLALSPTLDPHVRVVARPYLSFFQTPLPMQ